MSPLTSQFFFFLWETHILNFFELTVEKAVDFKIVKKIKCCHIELLLCSHRSQDDPRSLDGGEESSHRIHLTFVLHLHTRNLISQTGTDYRCLTEESELKSLLLEQN